VLLADVSTGAQLGGLMVAFITLLGLGAIGFFVVQSKARDVALETANTWRDNAAAEKAERERLAGVVEANRVELDRLREQAPGLAEIAQELRSQQANGYALAQTIARIDQSLQLVVREQGERRREYRGPVPIDPLTTRVDADEPA
jgi:uncharacterized protein HemX